MSNSTAFNPFTVIQEQQNEIPDELAASCKKVFKKDVATRLKGLQEIISWVTSSHCIDAFNDDFLKIYLEFSVDPDRQVRETVQKLLGQVIKSHRSFLKPLIKRIGPKFLGSLFDPVPTVSEVSLSAFKEMFKDDKVAAFCALIEKELVLETLEACSGSLTTLQDRLRLMGEDRQNINYSCDLYFHYLIRTVIFASSKLGKPIDALSGIELKPITNMVLDSLHGSHAVFLRQTLYRFLAACSTRLVSENYYGRLDGLIGLLQVEQDAISLVALLTHLENLLVCGLVDSVKFRPAMFKFCSRILSACNSQVAEIVMKILSAYYPDAEALNSLQRNFQSRAFVEADLVKPFVELYVSALSKFAVEDSPRRRQNLYKMVLEEKLPLSSLSLTYYLDVFLNTWQDGEFADLLVASVEKCSNPTKLLLKLPLARLWDNVNVQQLCVNCIRSSPIAEVAKIMSALKNSTTIETLLGRFSNLALTESDSIMIIKLSEKESIPSIMDIAASKFENLGAEDQEQVLLHLDRSLWSHLFKITLNSTSLKKHLLENDLKLAIQVGSIVSGPMSLDLQDLFDHFDATHHHLDEDDCTALVKTFNANRDQSGLNALISLVYWHGQETLLPLLRNELDDFDDELQSGLVDLCFSNPKVFSLLAGSPNRTAFTKLIAEKLVSQNRDIQIASFSSAAAHVLDDIFCLTTPEASHFLAVVILQAFVCIHLDYRSASLESNNLSDIFSLTRRLSSCICSDASFNDQLIEQWIIGDCNETDLIPLMLREIPVSVENLVNVYSILRCVPSDSFKQKYLLGHFTLSSDVDIVAAVYAIIGSDSVDVSKILEALPEDIDAENLFRLARILAEEVVAKKLSIRSDLLSYILKRYQGDPALKLKLIANTCHYGRINVVFWDHWTNDLAESIDIGLGSFESSDDLEALKYVLRIACKYANQEATYLAGYSEKLYKTWTKFGCTHQKCGIVKEITGMLSVIARQHITGSFKTMDANEMLDIFINSTNVHDLLVVRFLMTLKIDDTLETLKMQAAKQSQQKNLFPSSDFAVMFRDETITIRKLLLVDMFMSYLEGASDATGLADLYNEAFQEISRDAIGLCLGLLGWETKSPFDLNKHEFVVIDTEEVLCSETDVSIKIYAANLFARIVKSAPSAVRSYHAGLSKELRILFEKHFVNFMSPIMTAREISRLKRYEKSNPKDALKIKVLQTSTNCGVQAQYSLEDLSVELGLQVPSLFPLEPITVTGGKRLGISENKWRSWILSCQAVFKSDSISILDGLLHWKRNVEKSLEGMEPCPICYCIFHASDKTLPGPSCKTCNNKYHSSCLYKWFKSSGNATCPMCRSVF